MAQDRKEGSQGMFGNYPIKPGTYDEVFHGDRNINHTYKMVLEQFSQYTTADFFKIDHKARQSFFKQGVTFMVNTDNVQGEERIFPFDLLPRIIDAQEWEKLEKGVIQRNLALNAFLHDIYHQQHIFRDKIIPRELVLSSRFYCEAMQQLDPAGGIYNHISGTDLIRHSDGEYYVLEDNVRTPSGISYVLANREAMKKTLQSLFGKTHIQPLKEYTDRLLSMMLSVAPPDIQDPSCAVLTDGMVASAYFEHAFLAHSMGIPLVEGKDLYVKNDRVYMKTTRGPQQLHVLYRRVEDEYLDPLTFLPDSVYGVPGIMEAYRKGNICLMNAPGTGAADDKAVYTYVPAMIRYYLHQEPILQNVQTFHCTIDSDYAYVLENLNKLVVKPVDEFGGYGMLVGNTATKAQIEDFKGRISQNRRKYIAQPIMSLSTHPTFIKEKACFEPRHIDLRVYTLLGKDRQFVLKGGLTRVALGEGNLVVNSSQGGGSKDTWVLSPIDNTHTIKAMEMATMEMATMEMATMEMAILDMQNPEQTISQAAGKRSEVPEKYLDRQALSRKNSHKRSSTAPKSGD